MNYFRCTVGGSGKGNTVTVTCAEEFAGLTITLSKTGKTYTKTCPSTAPYVVTFYGVENGTYTVSCTVDGQTYSETVIVQDISCVLNYGFNWKIWVDTASQLDSSDYDSLDEVLADEKALRELFLEHACVDYMASVAASNEDLETVINDDYCAKWINLSDYALDYLYANEIIADLMDEADKYFYGEWVITDSTTTPPTWGPKGNVPVMTSNTAPYGEASSYRVYGSTTAAYKAFDNDSSSYYSNGANRTTSDYLQYVFTLPIIVKRVFIAKDSSKLSDLANVIIRASNDGTTWVNFNTVDISSDMLKYVDIDNNTAYRYWRIQNNDTSSTNYMAVGKLQFYGRELSASVPIMTNYTVPFGEVSSSQEVSNFYAYYAFNGEKSVANDHIFNTSTELAENYLAYDFKYPVALRRVESWLRNDNYKTQNVQAFKVQYYENGAWIDATSTLTNTTSDYGKTVSYNIPPAGAHKKWRMFILTNFGGADICVPYCQFYGLDYSEKEFEVGSTKKWLYDHGVELETLNYYTNNADSYAKNDGENIEVSIPATAQRVVFAYSQINLTDYNYLRAKVGNTFVESVTFAVHSTATPSPDATTATAYKSYNAADTALPNNCCLDVSAINQTLYAGVRVSNVSSTAVRKADVSELWLE